MAKTKTKKTAQASEAAVRRVIALRPQVWQSHDDVALALKCWQQNVSDYSVEVVSKSTPFDVEEFDANVYPIHPCTIGDIVMGCGMLRVDEDRTPIEAERLETVLSIHVTKLGYNDYLMRQIADFVK